MVRSVSRNVHRSFTLIVSWGDSAAYLGVICSGELWADTVRSLRTPNTYSSAAYGAPGQARCSHLAAALQIDKHPGQRPTVTSSRSLTPDGPRSASGYVNPTASR